MRGVKTIMYTELGAIKDLNGVCGLIVNDGTITMSIDMERAKRIAARGEMDTLAYEDGRFVPVIQGPLRRELMEEKALKRYEKACENMTFEDFIANDTIFKNEDVLWMRENENAVLASVSMAYEIHGKNELNYLMTLAFWSWHREATERLELVLASYKPYIPSMTGYVNRDGFIMTNLPLRQPDCGFELLKLADEAGVHMRYNLESLDNMTERARFMLKCSPFFTGLMLRAMMPTQAGMDELAKLISDKK